jgi:sec-independent protein translocase protein TatA
MGLGLENPLHILILLVVVLLVFGAKRLPEMGHSLGAGLRGFKESLTGERAAPTFADLNTAASSPGQVSNAAGERASLRTEA